MAKLMGTKKRNEMKLMMGCIKGEIDAGRRDATIANMLEGTSVTNMVTLVRWMMSRAKPKARRYQAGRVQGTGETRFLHFFFQTDSFFLH